MAGHDLVAVKSPVVGADFDFLISTAAIRALDFGWWGRFYFRHGSMFVSIIKSRPRKPANYYEKLTLNICPSTRKVSVHQREPIKQNVINIRLYSGILSGLMTLKSTKMNHFLSNTQRH